MKKNNPNIVPSDVSSFNSLQAEMQRCGIMNLDDGAKLTPQETRDLSESLNFMSPRFTEKFLSDDNNPSLTCFAAQIQQPSGVAYAYVWARMDKLSIDLDLAVLPLGGNTISAIYEPPIDGRTTLSADTYSDFTNCPRNFKVSDLESTCSGLYNAFKYCMEQ